MCGVCGCGERECVGVVRERVCGCGERESVGVVRESVWVW